MGRYGEIWESMGRYGEVWGEMGRHSRLEREAKLARAGDGRQLEEVAAEDDLHASEGALVPPTKINARVVATALSLGEGELVRGVAARHARQPTSRRMRNEDWVQSRAQELRLARRGAGAG